MHYLFVEEQLRGLDSHHQEYLNCITKHAAQHDRTTTTVCGKSFDDYPNPHPLQEVKPLLHPVSGRTINSIASRWKRMCLVAFNVVRNALAIWREVASQPKQVAVVVPTTWTPQILMLIPSLIWYRNKISAIHLILVYQLVQGERNSRAAIALKKALRIAHLVRSDVRLFTETDVGISELSKVSGLKFKKITHPVEMAQQVELRQHRQSLHKSADKNDEYLQIAFLGFARYEQGVDVLQTAMLKWLSQNESNNIHFYLKWQSPFLDASGQLVEPTDELLRHPSVTIASRTLDEAEYRERLANADCIVCPYRTESYAGRMSLILIEALCLGIPVIASKGTNQQRVLDEFETGICVEPENANELADAFDELALNFDIYKNSAAQAATMASERFSSRQFWIDLTSSELTNDADSSSRKLAKDQTKWNSSVPQSSCTHSSKAWEARNDSFGFETWPRFHPHSKLARLVYFAPSGKGGLADYAVHQSIALSDHIDHLCVVGHPELESRLDHLPNVEFKRLPIKRSWLKQTRVGRATNLMTETCSNVKQLAETCERLNPKNVLFNSYFEYFSPLWAKHLRRLKSQDAVKIGCVVHDPIRDYHLGPRWWHQMSIEQAYSVMDVAFVHSKVELNCGLKNNLLRTVVVPHGIYNFPEPDSKVARTDVRSELGIPEDATVVLSFGHIRDGKNLDQLIRSLNKFPNIHLVVAGREQSNSQRSVEYYRKLATEIGVAGQCHWFHQHIEEAEVWKFFHACDYVALLYSADFKSASGVLNTAAQFEKPVVASGGEGPLLEAVKKYQVGKLVPLNSQLPDVQALKKTLWEIENGSINEQLNLNWQRYIEDHSWQSNAEIVVSEFLDPNQPLRESHLAEAIA